MTSSEKRIPEQVAHHAKEARCFFTAPVGTASLPGRAGQGGADGVGQAAVGVGGDEGHAGQAAGGQVAEERQPPGAVFGGGDLQAEDLAVPVGIDPGRQQGVHVHDPAALADLQHQRVRRDEGVRAGVQRPGPEVLHGRVEIRGHHRDLRLAQPGDAQRLDQLLHPPRRYPEQIAGRHDRRQRRLRPAAPLQQPIREVAARPELRDRHVQRPGAGIEVPVPVAVADIHPVRARHAVRGTADRVGLGRHQRVHERGQHRAQQIRGRGRELVVQKAGRVDTAGCGHRDVSFRSTVRGLPKDHAVAALHVCATPVSERVRTPLCWTQLRWPALTASRRDIPARGQYQERPG
jgi:collagen type II alpha